MASIVILLLYNEMKCFFDDLILLAKIIGNYVFTEGAKHISVAADRQIVIRRRGR